MIAWEQVERLECDIYEAMLHLQELISLRDRYGFENLHPLVFDGYHDFIDYIRQSKKKLKNGKSELVYYELMEVKDVFK